MGVDGEQGVGDDLDLHSETAVDLTKIWIGFGLSIVQILEEFNVKLEWIQLISIVDNGKEQLVHMLF